MLHLQNIYEDFDTPNGPASSSVGRNHRVSGSLPASSWPYVLGPVEMLTCAVWYLSNNNFPKGNNLVCYYYYF